MKRNLHKLQENGPDILVSSPEIQIERWPVDRLIPSDVNPRTHSGEQVAQIAASIREFGFVNPILIGPDGGIIAGEGRLRAARTQGPASSGGLGISSLPLLADSAKLSDSAVRNCFSVLSVLFPAAVFNLPDSSDMTLLNLSGADVWSCCICSMN